MRLLALAALAALLPDVAAAQRLRVTGGEFYAESFDAEGGTLRVVTDRIVHRPGTSCYAWRIDFRPVKGVRTLTERMTLPAPAENWGGVDGNPETITALTPERDVADTSLAVALPTGVASHGWCVAEGDPLGAYRIEVFDGRRMLRRFDFVVERSRDLTN